MKSTFNAATLFLALGLPFAAANAQTTPAPDPHHPASPATATPPAAGQPAAPPGAGAAQAAPPMGMMMGDMRQMMGMMQQMMQMMQMMGGGAGAGTAGGPMMGGGMPMMGMMPGSPGGGPGGGSGGGPGMGMGPGMFRHTEGILGFYKAELRITDAQTPQWNGFADAARAGAKNMREGMQHMAAQAAAATMPEQLERRVAMLGSFHEAAKSVAAAAKTLYAVLTPEQRKLADEFMADHMRGMRRMVP